MKKDKQKALRCFLQHWGNYQLLQPYHQEWVQRNIQFNLYARNSCVYDSLWEEEHIFYVSSGLLARVIYYEDPKTKKQKRNILCVALPKMALMSTNHLYSKTQTKGEIIALRPSKILSISYEKIHRFIRDDPSLNSLILALSNKKNRQFALLRHIDTLPSPIEAYKLFQQSFPELTNILSQTEQQDLLNISRSTIQRTSYFLLTGKNKR